MSNNFLGNTISQSDLATETTLKRVEEALALGGASNATIVDVNIPSQTTFLEVNIAAQSLLDIQVQSGGVDLATQTTAASQLTSLQLLDDTVVELGTNTYTEATSKGNLIGVVRSDILLSKGNTNNEIVPLQVNNEGALYTTSNRTNLDYFNARFLRRVFESRLLFSKDVDVWEEVGTIDNAIYDATTQSIDYDNTMSIQDFVRRTKRRFSIALGQDFVILMEVKFEADLVNKRTSCGWGNDGQDTAPYMEFYSENGVGIRAQSEGAVIDVVQTNWNVDTLNGSGPSGITVNFTTSSFVAVLMGNNRSYVRQFGVLVQGQIIVCHRIVRTGTDFHSAWSNMNNRLYYRMESLVSEATIHTMSQGQCVIHQSHDGSERPSNPIMRSMYHDSGIFVAGGQHFACAGLRYDAAVANTEFVEITIYSIHCTRSSVEGFYLITLILNPTIANTVAGDWTAETITGDTPLEFFRGTETGGDRLISGGLLLYSVGVNDSQCTFKLPSMGLKLGEGDEIFVGVEARQSVTNAKCGLSWFEGAVAPWA